MNSQLSYISSFRGEFNVGTIQLEFEDKARQLVIKETKGARRIPVILWYPTEQNSQDQSDRALFLDMPFYKFYKKAGMFFRLFFMKPRPIPMCSFKDVPLISGSKKFPLILFHHGYVNALRVSVVDFNEYSIRVISLLFEGYKVITVRCEDLILAEPVVADIYFAVFKVDSDIFQFRLKGL